MKKISENIVFDKKSTVPAGMERSDTDDIVEYLFSENNRLLTANGADFELPKETQSLLAYFRSVYRKAR